MGRAFVVGISLLALLPVGCGGSKAGASETCTISQPGTRARIIAVGSSARAFCRDRAESISKQGVPLWNSAFWKSEDGSNPDTGTTILCILDSPDSKLEVTVYDQGQPDYTSPGDVGATFCHQFSDEHWKLIRTGGGL